MKITKESLLNFFFVKKFFFSPLIFNINLKDLSSGRAYEHFDDHKSLRNRKFIIF